MNLKIDRLGFLVFGTILLTGIFLLSAGIQWRLVIAALTVISLLIFKFTVVPEAKAKGIIRLGAYKKIVMAWDGHKLDQNGDVVEGKEPHPLGGLRYVGVRLIDTVYKYVFRWIGLELVEGQEKPEFHEKEISYIQVKPDTYYTAVEGVETMAPERIPVKLEWLVTMRVKNPRKALWEAPENWNENVMARFNALSSMWVSSKKFLDDLLKIREHPETIWNELGSDPLIKFFDEKWGIEILKNGIELRGVTPPKEYQAALARQKQMELEMKGRVVETVGVVIEMMASARGKKIEEIQKEIDGDPEMKKEFLEIAKDLLIRKMGLDKGAYTDIRVEGAEGIERTLLNALALWMKMPQGKREESEATKTRTYEDSLREYEERKKRRKG